jgi:hypothetical protein
MSREPFYRQRWFRIAIPVVVVLAAYVLLHYNQPEETLLGWAADAVALIAMFVGTLALASQYILPVRTLQERQGATERLFTYVSGGHGPIVFVRDGELIGSAEELKRKGAGVILLDGSSGVVLEKGNKFSRAHGPGILFSDYRERILATLDLRKQSRSQEAAALTRDGIEIKTNVSVTFALDPGDQSSPRDTLDEQDMLGVTKITPAFPFDPQSAFKAVYGYAVTDKEPLKWTDLPIMVVVELFRDLIAQKTLDDLFQPKLPDSSPVAALQVQLADRVQKAPLLKERGLKVYSVSIGMLELPESVTYQRIRSWASRWEKEILTKLGRADVETEQIKERARAEAQNEFFDKLKQTLLGEASDQNEVLRKLVLALKQMAEDPMTQMLMPYEVARKLKSLQSRYWMNVEPDDTEALKVIGQEEPPVLPAPEISAAEAEREALAMAEAESGAAAPLASPAETSEAEETHD